MIDDRINKTLSDMEANLKQVESARKQVESTVNSFNGLTLKTDQYVSSLSKANDNMTNLIQLVGDDYEKKVKSFEKDQKEIVDSCNSAISTVNQASNNIQQNVNAAIQNINNTSENVKENVSSTIDLLQKKMNYILIFNAIILMVMIILFFLKK